MSAAALSRRRQPIVVLNLVFWTAVAVSIVHYTDNYFAYDQFPQADGGPSPSRTAVGVSWFVFTAFGLGGYALFRQGHVRRASAFLAIYSISGIIGIGHYAANGMTDAVWWRQAHVVADVVLGLAVFGFAVWTGARPFTSEMDLGSCPRLRALLSRTISHALPAVLGGAQDSHPLSDTRWRVASGRTLASQLGTSTKCSMRPEPNFGRPLAI